MRMIRSIGLRSTSLKEPTTSASNSNPGAGATLLQYSADYQATFTVVDRSGNVLDSYTDPNASVDGNWYLESIPYQNVGAVSIEVALTSFYFFIDNLRFTIASPVFTGHVYCSCGNGGIAGATVQVGNLFTTTDKNGAYSLTNIPAGTSTVKVSASNFTTLTTNLHCLRTRR